MRPSFRLEPTTLIPASELHANRKSRDSLRYWSLFEFLFVGRVASSHPFAGGISASGRLLENPKTQFAAKLLVSEDALRRHKTRPAKCPFLSRTITQSLGNADNLCSKDHRITYPPSTLTVWPVTFAARSLARNTAIAATSSGVCQRLSGTSFAIFSAAHASYS